MKKTTQRRLQKVDLEAILFAVILGLHILFDSTIFFTLMGRWWDWLLFVVSVVPLEKNTGVLSPPK